MAAMQMDSEKILRFDELNEHLWRATRWRLVAVEGLLPEETFFSPLAAREFPVPGGSVRRNSWIIERAGCSTICSAMPPLMNPVFAEYMRAYGLGGLKARSGRGGVAASGAAVLVHGGRLIRSAQGLRIYGSVSSAAPARAVSA